MASTFTNFNKGGGNDVAVGELQNYFKSRFDFDLAGLARRE